MPFDPSVISQIPDMAPNPMAAKAQGFKLADLINTEQLDKLRVNQLKTEQDEQLKMKELLKTEDLSSPQGITKAAQKLTQSGLAQQGMKLMGLAQQYQTGAVEQEQEKLKLASQQADILAGALDNVYGQLEDFRTRNPKLATPEMMDTLAATWAIPAMKNLKQQYPELGQYIDKFGQNPQNLTYAGIKSAEAATNRGQQMLKERIAERGQATKEADEARKEREDRARDLARDKAAKPPAGFEWDPDKEDTLRPIPGGPKDPNSKPWTGREKVFSERIVTSANEASRAIKNITELPVGASTGVLGVGTSPGHSIFAAGRDVLRNKMSSQEVQDYGTMLAGVRRNLATIETTGLTPSGALTEGFASLELREGDTQTTKLRKLAEMRQIVDAGLEVQLADPAIPDSIKGVMNKVLTTVHEAVPFTQHDVTVLQRQQQKNPNYTLEQLVKDQGLSAGAAPVKAFSDPDKERRYQEWKKTHASQ